jgi:hypothetical protein
MISNAVRVSPCFIGRAQYSLITGDDDKTIVIIMMIPRMTTTVGRGEGEPPSSKPYHTISTWPSHHALTQFSCLPRQYNSPELLDGLDRGANDTEEGVELFKVVLQWRARQPDLDRSLEATRHLVPLGGMHQMNRLVRG